MSGSQQLQDIINQQSLMQNTSEDIMKACKKAEIHPELAKVLMQLHTTQYDLDKELKAQRKVQMAMAKVIDQLANNSIATKMIMDNLAERTGLDITTLFAPEGDTVDET